MASSGRTRARPRGERADALHADGAGRRLPRVRICNCMTPDSYSRASTSACPSDTAARSAPHHHRRSACSPRATVTLRSALAGFGERRSRCYDAPCQFFPRRVTCTRRIWRGGAAVLTRRVTPASLRRRHLPPRRVTCLRAASPASALRRLPPRRVAYLSISRKTAHEAPIIV